MFVRGICLSCFISFTFLLSGCSDVNFGLDAESLDTIFSSNGVLINDNDLFTNQSDVRLQLFGFEGQEMYITNDHTCESGGQWIPYTQIQNWILSEVNTQVSVYVKFRNNNANGEESDCISDDIIHDDIPPEVSFIKHPGEQTNQQDSHFILGAMDEGSGVAGYYCGNKVDYQECDFRQDSQRQEGSHIIRDSNRTVRTVRVDLVQLIEGVNQFSYFVEDRAGNQSDVLEYKWEIDLTPPAVYWERTPLSLTRETVAHFEYSATDDRSIEVLFECRVDQGGAFPCDPTHEIDSLMEGGHSFQVTGYDRAGNSATLDYEWVVDITPPVVSIVEAPPLYSRQSLSKFRFTSEDVHSVPTLECRIDEELFKSCNKEASFLVPDGQHQLTVRARDMAGNVSAPVTHNWGVDSEPPIVDITLAETARNLTYGRFSFTAKDSWTGIKSIYCGVDGVMESCVDTFSYDNLFEGVHFFEVYAEDQVGNLSPVQRHRWEIDAIPPFVRITSGPKSRSNSPEAILEFEGTKGLREIRSYQCSMDGGAFKTCSSPYKVSHLKEGSHVFQVVAYDNGNLASKQASYSWDTDFTSPTVDIVEAPAPYTNQTKSEFKFMSQDADALQVFECRLDNGNFDACHRETSFLVSEGQYQLSVRVRDLAGNISDTVSHEWVVDVTPPEVSIVEAPPRYSRQSLSEFKFMSQEADSTLIFECRLNQEPFQSCNKEVSFLVPDGQHQLTVRTRDLAGNVSAPVTHSWGVDLEFPIVEITLVETARNLTHGRFAFTAKDSWTGIKNIYCGVDGVMESCVDTFSYDNLFEGVHFFEVYAEDQAGNFSSIQRHRWEIDAIPPSIRITNGPKSRSNSTEAVLEFEGIKGLREIHSYQCSMDGGAFKICSSPYKVSYLKEGSHVFRVVAYDSGHSASRQDSYAWNIDLTRPTVDIVKAPDLYTNQTRSEFEFMSPSADALQTFECRLENSSFEVCHKETSFLVSEGNHRLSVRVRDLAGNISDTVSHKWGVDLQPPVVEITLAKVARNSPDASFSFTAKDSWTGVKNVYCGVNGVMQLCIDTINYGNLSAGLYIFEVYAEDHAGNRSPVKRHEWEIDLIPPSVYIISGPKPWSNSTEAVLEFEGTKGLREIHSYQCSLDGEVFKTCSSPYRVFHLKEGSHVFRVVARDHANVISKEASYSWNTDLTGPVIQWGEVPPAHRMGEESFASFFATDALSGVGESHCQINSTNVSCEIGQMFRMDYLMNGLNTLIVNVFDKTGNMSSLTYQWEVFHPYQRIKQSIRVKEPQIDVLFVVDNSKSMSEEHKSLAERLDNFTDYLVDLNWRIAVTTTNPTRSKDVKAGDGKLALFPHKKFHIDNDTLEESLAMDYLKHTVVVPIMGGMAKREQGIRATYRAIQRFLPSEKSYVSRPNKEFFRNGAALAVILISDENEYPNHIGDNPESLIQLVRDTWGAQKTFVFHSIIVKEGDSDCLGMGNEHSEGIQYAALSRQTGGVIGSVCEPDYANQLAEIGDHVRMQVLSIKLDCPSVDINKDGVNDITLLLDNGSEVIDFSYNEKSQSLQFSEALSPGVYNLEYFCEKSL